MKLHTVIGIFLFICTFFGCTKKNSSLISLSHKLKFGKIDCQAIDSNFIAKKKCFISSKKHKSNGVYDSIYKVGGWNYSLNGIQDSINWRFFHLKDKQAIINAPVDWKFYKYDENLVTLLFNQKDTTGNSFFIIRDYPPKNYENSFNSFCEINYAEIQKSFSINRIENNEFFNEKGNYHYLEFDYMENGIKYSRISLFAKSEGLFYMFLYSFEKEKIERNRLLFTDLILGFKHKGKTVLERTGTFEKVEEESEWYFDFDIKTDISFG